MSRRSAGAGGSRGGSARESHVVTNGSSFLLDNFTHTPKFAGWLGGRLRSAYSSYICRIRRGSDSATLDVGYDAHGIVDTAAIAAFCAGTTGFLVTLYDQSGNGNHITQATTTKQPIVYASAALKTGTNGYLAAHFDLDQFLRAAYSRTGDIDLTIVNDVAPADADAYQVFGLFAASDANAEFAGEFWYGTDPYVSVDRKGAAFTEGAYHDLNTTTDRWLQFSRAAGDLLKNTVLRINGTVTAWESDSGGAADQTVNLNAAQLLFGASEASWSTAGSLGSIGLFFEARLSAAEQAALDAWMLGHHA